MGSNEAATGGPLTATRKRSRAEAEEDASSGKMTIHVQGQHEAVTFKNVPRNLPLHTLLKKYCSNRKMEYLAMRFVYKGRRVLVRSTPHELRMEDGAVIWLTATADEERGAMRSRT